MFKNCSVVVVMLAIVVVVGIVQQIIDASATSYKLKDNALVEMSSTPILLETEVCTNAGMYVVYTRRMQIICVWSINQYSNIHHNTTRRHKVTSNVVVVVPLSLWCCNGIMMVDYCFVAYYRYQYYFSFYYTCSVYQIAALLKITFSYFNFLSYQFSWLVIATRCSWHEINPTMYGTCYKTFVKYSNYTFQI